MEKVSKQKRQSVGIDASLSSRIKAIAFEEGRSFADTARRLLDEALKLRSLDRQRNFEDMHTETLLLFLVDISNILRKRLIKSPEIPDLIRNSEDILRPLLGERLDELLDGETPTTDEIILLKALLPYEREEEVENWANEKQRRDHATNGNATGS